MKELTPEQLEARKKTNKKVLAFGCLPVLIFIIFMIFITYEPDPPKTTEEIRIEKIEEQFQPYTGEHFNLAHVIKQNMNDPDSYEHIETAYEDKGDYLLVGTRFRGKNAFGGKVVNTVKAKVDPKTGKVIEIME